MSKRIRKGGLNPAPRALNLSQAIRKGGLIPPARLRMATACTPAAKPGPHRASLSPAWRCRLGEALPRASSEARLVGEVVDAAGEGRGVDDLLVPAREELGEHGGGATPAFVSLAPGFGRNWSHFLGSRGGGRSAV